MAALYPDVSHYHPITDWAKAKANCPFLISKATQGTSYVDPTLVEFISGCENNKIPYWLFAYLNKGNELAQAKFLVSTCKDKVGDYFVGYVLDVETDNTAANVKSAMDYISGLGVKAMFYHMYADYASYKSVIASLTENCAWWEARYGNNTGSYSASYPCHSGVDLHQYTSNGTCSGVSGKCDLNRLTGTKDEAWFKTPLSTSASATSDTYTKTQFIKDVQSAIGVTVDGIAGSKTLAATPTISAKKNPKHAAVKPVQKYLYALGYTSIGTADGIAGSKFTTAVKAYQADHSCVSDGEITAKAMTWKKLLGLA